MAFKNARFLEQPNRSVNRGDRYAAVDRHGAYVQCLDVGMVLGLGQDARDDPPLFGDPKPFFGAQRLDIDPAGHNSRL